jgi:hypothetical protein
MRRLLIIISLILLALPVAAQEADPIYPAEIDTDLDVTVTLDSSVLTLLDARVVAEPDVFGQMTNQLRGTLANQTAVALTNITLFADLLDADDTLIGEGLGVMVNACGSGLLPDFTLQPGASQSFSMTFDFFDGDLADLAQVNLFPQTTTTEASSSMQDSIADVAMITDREVVRVEWIDETTLRYGVGCEADAFPYLDWYEYDLTSQMTNAITHPDADRITEQFIANVRIEDEFEFRRSFMQFAPNSDRAVFQSDVNHFYTATADGSARQFIWDNLSRHSLHGIRWADGDIFLAYYYGAFGEDVLYFTAHAVNGRISRSIYIVAPSVTVPGPGEFGTHVVIGTTFDDVTGYWYRHVFLTDRELLIETDLPGNNWPAPLVVTGTSLDSLIYIARPVDDEPRLQCYDRDRDALTDLTELPLNLTPDDRGWMWLSPDEQTIALAANGIDGGLWLVDLSALPACAG